MSRDDVVYHDFMSRWEPGAEGRLKRAALELYTERGFEQTTVAEIAARAGLTARTFFRYFADKREVLFAGQSTMYELIVNTVADAPESLSPIEAVEHTLLAMASFMEAMGEGARQRQNVISANAELRERELIKLASLTASIADALRSRGAADPVATLSAEAGVAVFKVAFERWVAQPRGAGLAALIKETFDELGTVIGSRE